MAPAGGPLIERVLLHPPQTYTQSIHYPAGDAIDLNSQARWFYHAHAPAERGCSDHGHFHLFLPQTAFGDEALLAAP